MPDHRQPDAALDLAVRALKASQDALSSSHPVNNEAHERRFHADTETLVAEALAALAPEGSEVRA